MLFLQSRPLRLRGCCRCTPLVLVRLGICVRLQILLPPCAAFRLRDDLVGCPAHDAHLQNLSCKNPARTLHPRAGYCHASRWGTINVHARKAHLCTSLPAKHRHLHSCSSCCAGRWWTRAKAGAFSANCHATFPSCIRLKFCAVQKLQSQSAKHAIAINYALSSGDDVF